MSVEHRAEAETLRVLVLGGTMFLGRHVTDALLARRHEVVHLNRGRSAPALFPSVERVTADRSTPGAFDSLRGRTFDAVLDCAGYAPRDVRAAASALRDTASRYAFVSSISVYDVAQPRLDESAAVLELPPEADADGYDAAQYGAYKARCERAAREAFGADRTFVVRPGLIVGPHDPTDRFTYWPVRIARGGDVLAPAGPAYPLQVIDVRDLAAFVVDGLERGTTGTYNATGPAGAESLGSLVAVASAHARGPVRMHWVDEAFLSAREVGPWVELPLWVPEAEMGASFRVDVTKALAAGLRVRPLAETVADTLAWADSRGAGHAWRAGLRPERERALLDAWAARDR